MLLCFYSTQSFGTFLVSRKSSHREESSSESRFDIHFLRSGSFSQTQVSPLYFDREDVKRAIHAPLNVTWHECSEQNVFPNGDASEWSAFTVLPNAIEKSERAVIVQGMGDFYFMPEG